MSMGFCSACGQTLWVTSGCTNPNATVVAVLPMQVRHIPNQLRWSVLRVERWNEEIVQLEYLGRFATEEEALHFFEYRTDNHSESDNLQHHMLVLYDEASGDIMTSSMDEYSKKYELIPARVKEALHYVES